MSVNKEWVEKLLSDENAVNYASLMEVACTAGDGEELLRVIALDRLVSMRNSNVFALRAGVEAAILKHCAEYPKECPLPVEEEIWEIWRIIHNLETIQSPRLRLIFSPFYVATLKQGVAEMIVENEEMIVRAFAADMIHESPDIDEMEELLRELSEEMK